MNKVYCSGVRLGITVGMSIGIFFGMEILLVQGHGSHCYRYPDDIRTNEFTGIDTLDGLYKPLPILNIRQSEIYHHEPPMNTILP